GVYEVIPVYAGVALRAREHFERLQRSMDEIRLANPHTIERWTALVMELLAHHPGNQSVYIQVTRGAAPKRDHVMPKDLAPNVFVVKDGVVAAAPWDNLILLGITYDLLVRLAADGGVRLEVRAIPQAELRAADEIWLSSSTKEVLAVTRLDGKPVGSGKPGPV